MMNCTSVRRQIRMVVGCSLSFFAVVAMADDTVSISDSLYALSNPEDANVAQPNAWHFTVGAGMVVMPKFPGASGSKVEGVPLLGASYGRYFIGSNPDAGALLALGGYLYRDSNWRVGLAVTYDFIEPRQESDDSRLYGLGDVKRTAHAELFAVYTLAWMSARGSVSTDIAGNKRGTVATFDVMARYQPIPQLTLTAGPGLTWGSSQYNQTYFGVNDEQSARSGLPGYSPSSGLNNLRFSVGANYRLATHWNVGATITAAWLQGDSGNSPIVEKKNQMTYGLFANYLF
jgi:outer membrane protein